MAQTLRSALLLQAAPTAEQAHAIHQQLDRERDPQTGPPLPAVFPRDRAPYPYALRFDLLGQLISHLEHPDPPLRSAVLTGPPGIGTTRLAAEYLHYRRSRYDQLGWVTAQPTTTAAADLDRLAAELDLKHVPAGLDTPLQFAALAVAVLGALRHGQPRRVLLVIDNLDHLQPAAAERVWHPPATRGSRLRLLLTSRQHAGWQHTRQLTVGPPSPQAAAEFLRQRTGTPPASPDGSQDPADTLAAALDYHPAALEHAGAYINRAGISIATYLDLIRDPNAHGQLGGHLPADTR